MYKYKIDRYNICSWVMAAVDEDKIYIFLDILYASIHHFCIHTACSIDIYTIYIHSRCYTWFYYMCVHCTRMTNISGFAHCYNTKIRCVNIHSKSDL